MCFRLLNVVNPPLVCRVVTFNDCEEAVAELQKQITEAREDLRSKGFKFD